MLTSGTRAPDFSLKDSEGQTVTLSQFRDKSHVVLVFYPGDNTPVCTKQMCGLRDDYSAFKDAGVVILGINPQSAESHQGFSAKHGLPFPLLVDSEGSVIRAYGCKGLLMTARTVYGIDKAGTIVFAQRGRPSSSEILAAFKPK